MSDRRIDLPEPDYPMGYGLPFLREILGDRYPEFSQWFVGQTGVMADDGKKAQAVLSPKEAREEEGVEG